MWLRIRFGTESAQNKIILSSNEISHKKANFTIFCFSFHIQEFKVQKASLFISRSRDILNKRTFQQYIQSPGVKHR